MEGEKKNRHKSLKREKVSRKQQGQQPEVTLLMPAVPKETGIQLPAQPAPYPTWAAPLHPRYTEQQEQWVAEIRTVSSMMWKGSQHKHDACWTAQELNRILSLVYYRFFYSRNNHP